MAKFKVTYQDLNPEQLAGREPYGYSEKYVEETEAESVTEAIQNVKDWIVDKLAIDQPEPLRLFDPDIDNKDDADVSADIIVVNTLTDKILYGYYNFEAIQI